MSNEETHAAFEEFDKALQLPPEITAQAQDRRATVDEALIQAGIVSSSFLQGSFGRKTMLPPLNDVDVVVILTPSYSGMDASAAIAAVTAVIKHELPEATVDTEKQAAKAIQMQFPGDTFTVDIVTARELAEPELIEIANRENNQWERSLARRLKRVIQERNQACDGRFIRQVRMLKQIAKHNGLSDLSNGKAVCGLLIETLAYETIDRSLNHDVAIAKMVAKAPTIAAGAVFDPSGENDLTEDWSIETRAEVIEILEHLSKRTCEAVAAHRDGNESLALQLWSDICGDKFPTATLNEEEALDALWQDGGVTATGRITTDPQQVKVTARPTRSWLDI
jgi:hypothetical protein